MPVRSHRIARGFKARENRITILVNPAQFSHEITVREILKHSFAALVEGLNKSCWSNTQAVSPSLWCSLLDSLEDALWPFFHWEKQHGKKVINIRSLLIYSFHAYSSINKLKTIWQCLFVVLLNNSILFFLLTSISCAVLCNSALQGWEAAEKNYLLYFYHPSKPDIIDHFEWRGVVG